MLKAIDFFCGAGGVTCGFSNANIEVLGGIDINSKFKETYEANSKAIFINKDVTKFPPEELSQIVPVTKNQDDLVFIGCSPCQYYSNMNSDKNKAKSGRLLLEDFKNFVLHYKPGFVFIENVPGLETKSGSPLSRFKKSLKAEGYSFDEKVLNAKYFKVAQNRRRFVLIATRLGNAIQLPAEEKTNMITVREAIGNYAKFKPIKHGHQDDTNFIHSASRLTDLNFRRVQKVRKNGGNRLDFADDDELQLDCYKGHDGHTDVYGRLFWDKPSPTITTRFIYTSTGRYTHPEQDRGLSLREGATLQSFPIDYKFISSNQGAIATMIGNAVPPNLAKSIGENFVNHWNKWQHSKQKPVRQNY